MGFEPGHTYLFDRGYVNYNVYDQLCDKGIFFITRLKKNAAMVALEATGHYWLSVYTFLNDLGYPLVVINPIQTDAFRKFSIRKAKTDPIDSKLIANIIRTHSYELSSFTEENLFSLRQLSRYRLSLVDNCSDL
ncbi:MAG: transposase [Clostridia bacterium]|nr:transposase [Clostridia bacterium]